MSLDIGIVGLPNAGKTTIFNALTRAGGEVTAYPTRTEKTNVGIAPIPDERLGPVAAVIGSERATPAALRVLDVPGTTAAQLGQLRQAAALLAVVDGFSPGADPPRDLEALGLELLVADRDHVERRLERVRRSAKSGDVALRREVTALERVLGHLEAGGSLADYGEELPEELEPLTTKPLIPLVNGPDAVDGKLELELAELPEEEAAAFREGPSALDEVVRRVFESLDLLTFFTANEQEARAWTLRSGETALAAAAAIHSDIARGFIRAEVIRWNDLLECGSRAEAARRGLQRLEGKSYVVADGDVLQIRFHV